MRTQVAGAKCAEAGVLPPMPLLLVGEEAMNEVDAAWLAAAIDGEGPTITQERERSPNPAPTIEVVA